jgi:hypothetical protein
MADEEHGPIVDGREVEEKRWRSHVCRARAETGAGPPYECEISTLFVIQINFESLTLFFAKENLTLLPS